MCAYAHKKHTHIYKCIYIYVYICHLLASFIFLSFICFSGNLIFNIRKNCFLILLFNKVFENDYIQLKNQ